ncbi:diaminopimelate decarboxylase [Prochlorococcus sp. MIT 1300]|uniref:diaminopimelate decarboxylase n=1 Tax=Prochlorococcus sp. MIT 1300 TaxID=3096218 RepID=UPI002A75595E|nr:diaminopimelate decarboxylase [Prochlorococcus sp. MIT 1300]
MKSKTPYESNSDHLSPNRNIAPITTEINDEGALVIGGCDLPTLASRYGTPLYILDELTLRATCRGYIKALKNHYKGSSLPLYASKANSSLVLSKLVSSEGFGLDVVSEGELITALESGVKGEDIFLHGNNKSIEELSLAYDNDVTVVVDNNHDLDCLEEIVSSKPARLMLRLTPGIECHTHEYIKTGHLDSKFGFDPDQFEEVLLRLKNAPWARLTGLHAHIGSQIFELQPHRDLAVVLADALKLARDFGHPVDDLNVGGGLGIRYIKEDDPPSIDEWVAVISRSLEEACMERKLELPRLICEPGRSLVATAGVTLYRLGSRKVIPGIRTYLSVDGGMSDNPRPITYQSLYTACLAEAPLASGVETVTIAGKHCESGDVVIKRLELPPSKSGDVLVVFSTGAYNSSMSSNYNRIPRPATVMVQNGQSDLVQRREVPEDLIRLDVLPSRFGAVK